MTPPFKLPALSGAGIQFVGPKGTYFLKFPDEWLCAKHGLLLVPHVRCQCAHCWKVVHGLMGLLLKDERVMKRAGWDQQAPAEAPRNWARLNDLELLLAEMGQLCCWVGDEKMKALYESIGIKVDMSVEPWVDRWPDGYDTPFEGT